MIKRVYNKNVLILLLAVMCLWLNSVAAEQTNVGRDNPFAQLSKEKKPAPIVEKVVKEPNQPQEQLPELFVETVTLKLIDADSLKTVIESMLSQYGRVSVNGNSNSLIICDAKENLEKILAQIHKADKTSLPQKHLIEQEHKPTLRVETVTLKFLDAANLKAAISSMSSEYGSISVDEKSNSIVVCDTEENLKMVLAEISNADKRPQQIMVEVVILDVQLEDDTEIGINWDVLSDKRHNVDYRQNFTTTRLGSTIEDSTTIGNLTAFNTTGLGGDFSIIYGNIRNVVHLVQQKRNVEILASPRVMMVSGESAFIKATEEIPYEQKSDTSQGGELTSTEFKDVGVSLEVSAVVTDNNNILLGVEASQSAKTGESIKGVPVVDNRMARASLLLEDGQVVVIGGLRRKEITKETDQIPFLADLPVIGDFFKSTDDTVTNSELIVFLSPHIYKGQQPGEKEMEKFKEITEKPLLSLPKEKESDDDLLSLLTID